MVGELRCEAGVFREIVTNEVVVYGPARERETEYPSYDAFLDGMEEDGATTGNTRDPDELLANVTDQISTSGTQTTLDQRDSNGPWTITPGPRREVDLQAPQSQQYVDLPQLFGNHERRFFTRPSPTS